MPIPLIFGTTFRDEPRGEVADWCDNCGGVERFAVMSVYDADHVFFLRVTSWRFYFTARECWRCRARFVCDPGDYDRLLPKQEALSLSRAELLSRTNPSLQSSLARPARPPLPGETRDEPEEGADIPYVLPAPVGVRKPQGDGPPPSPSRAQPPLPPAGEAGRIRAERVVRPEFLRAAPPHTSRLLRRALVGLGLGMVWALASTLFWFAAMKETYGGFGEAWRALQEGRVSVAAVGVLLVASLASWVGGVVAPCALSGGDAPRRPPVVTSSAVGGILGGLSGVVVGGLIGQWFWHSPAHVEIALVAGVAVGVLGGWVASRLMRRAVWS
jgi:hypothetical protein